MVNPNDPSKISLYVLGFNTLSTKLTLLGILYRDNLSGDISAYIPLPCLFPSGLEGVNAGDAFEN